MAESISEGTLSTFLKQLGDRVEIDDEIATIETDKIDVSVTATKEGVIAELLVSEGDVVAVGQDLVRIETAADSEATEKSTQTEKEQTHVPAYQEETKTATAAPRNTEPEEAPTKPEKEAAVVATPTTLQYTQPQTPVIKMPGYEREIATSAECIIPTAASPIRAEHKVCFNISSPDWVPDYVCSR